MAHVNEDPRKGRNQWLLNNHLQSGNTEQYQKLSDALKKRYPKTWGKS